EADERLERLDEVGVALLIVGEGTQSALRLGLDVAFRLAEEVLIRAEVLEVRRPPRAAVAPLEGRGLFRLGQREVCAGRAALRSAKATARYLISDMYASFGQLSEAAPSPPACNEKGLPFREAFRSWSNDARR